MTWDRLEDREERENQSRFEHKEQRLRGAAQSRYGTAARGSEVAAELLARAHLAFKSSFSPS